MTLKDLPEFHSSTVYVNTIIEFDWICFSVRLIWSVNESTFLIFLYKFANVFSLKVHAVQVITLCVFPRVRASKCIVHLLKYVKTYNLKHNIFAFHTNLKHAALITFPKTSSSFVNRKTSKRMFHCKWISQSRIPITVALQSVVLTKSLSSSSSSLVPWLNLPLSHRQSKYQLCAPCRVRVADADEEEEQNPNAFNKLHVNNSR